VPGIAGAYTNSEAQESGLPASGITDQASELYLAAQPGYSFAPGAEGPIVTDLPGARGTHGCLNIDPDMKALLIASGAHIRAGVDLGTISNLRVAPTIGKILGVSLPDAKQEPLTDAIQ
jgi:hypothetical protein